jgi:hypothetical protein
MYIVGIDPGRIYTQTQLTKGICPSVGTMGQTSDGKIFRMVEVTTSQNLVKGMIVSLDANHKATVAVAGGPAPGVAQELAVVIATVTASASQLVWAQLYGRCNVLASLSCNPNVQLTGGATAGWVDDVVSTLSAVIEGIHLTATATTGGGLTAAILNYPRYRPGTGV